MCEVTYKLEPNDVSAMFKYVWQTRLGMPMAAIFSSLLVTFAVDVAAALGRLPSRDISNNVLWGGLALVNVCMLFVLFTNVFYPWLLKRKVLQDPQTLGERRIRLSATEFYAWYLLGETTLHWQAISDVVEDADYLYIFLNKSHGWIIPKRVFADAEEARQFTNAAKQHWEVGKRVPVASKANDPTTWPPTPRSSNSQQLGEKPKR